MKIRIFEDEIIHDLILVFILISVFVIFMVSILRDRARKENRIKNIEEGQEYLIFSAEVDGHDYVILLDKENNRTMIHLDDCSLCKHKNSLGN